MPLDDLRTQLVLVMSAAGGSGAALIESAAASARIAPVATVILDPPPSNPMAPGELAAAVAALQELGIATLVSADPALARVVKADGVHLPPSKAATEAYREAREILGTRSIVGLDAGRTRHDAMAAGEEGADYIAFGIPEFVDDRKTARARRLELVAWWAEIFEIPCVAFDVETPEEARDLAEAGADFVAVRLPPGTTAQTVTLLLEPFIAGLRAAAAPA